MAKSTSIYLVANCIKYGLRGWKVLSILSHHMISYHFESLFFPDVKVNMMGLITSGILRATIDHRIRVHIC